VQNRVGDPFALWRRLMNHETMNLETMGGLLDQGLEPEASQMLDGLADVFGLVRLNTVTGCGLTDWEVKRVFTDFEQYLSSLKKSIEDGSRPSPATDSGSSISQEAQAEPESAYSL
jgi:hypothetical protein